MTTAITSAPRVSDRYEGRPLLRLVECYVLDSIGQLDQDDQQRLSAMTPKLRMTLSSDADSWQGVLEDALALPVDYPAMLRRDWDANREAATKAEQPISPQDFAETVADAVSR